MIAAWVGLEVGGKGTGAVTWLFSPGLTRDQGFHPMDIVGARPKGPVRLTMAEADATNARLAKAFGGNVPKHERTSAMQQLYELKPEARRPKNRSDLVECNKILRMEVFFAAVAWRDASRDRASLLVERKSDDRGPGRGEPFRMAVFLGSDEKRRFAFDLRGIRRASDLTAFTVRVFDKSGLRDLRAKDVSDGVLIVDDPGALQLPQGRSAAIYVYGGTQPPANGILSVQIEGDLLVRERFFAAVLGKPVGGVDASAPAPQAMPFAPRKENLHAMSGVSLRAALIDSLGVERAAKARFSQVSARSGRGSFYGVVLDDAQHLAIDVTDPADRKDYEFFWDGPDGLRAVTSITRITEREGRDKQANSGPYHLIRIAEAEAGAAERLLVFRRGERGAPIAGLGPLTEWLEAMAPLVEADAKALPDAGIDMNLVRREASSDAWMARCECFLSAYPSFEAKTSSDEWRRAACARGATEPRR